MMQINDCPYLLPCGLCTRYDCQCCEVTDKENKSDEKEKP